MWVIIPLQLLTSFIALYIYIYIYVCVCVCVCARARVRARERVRNRLLSWVKIKYAVDRWSLYYYYFEMENILLHSRKSCHLRQELLKNLILTFREGAWDV
jgi:hypothetical protein